MNTDGHRWSLSWSRVWRSPVRVGLGLLAVAFLLTGCGATGQGMLGGALKGWQEHELRQRPLQTNGLY